MKFLVTGSAGHLGEALMRRLPEMGHEVIGLDVRPERFVDVVASVADRRAVREAMDGADVVLHTATLHKPHVASHDREDFVETNVKGTLVALEEAAAARVGAFVFTSTTSTFGNALHPGAGDPAAWITEDVVPSPKNVYGVTKVVAEDLCSLVHQDTRMPVVVLRTSRFFPEADDDAERERGHPDLNLKVVELLHRRVDLEDVVQAHLRAATRAPDIGFGRYVVSATTPFSAADAADLRVRAPEVVARTCAPGTAAVFDGLGWSLPEDIDRVYVNDRARADLVWEPRYGFDAAVADLAAGRDPRSPVSLAVGAKGYHDKPTGVYTP